MTLQKLEQTENPAEAPESITELKRVVLNRIADLELSKILETADTATEEAPDPAELIPPPSAIEEDHQGESVESANLDMLD
ncbi:MAG: hypothetical protein ABSF70_16830 [Terracidiphilus sp.]